MRVISGKFKYKKLFAPLDNKIRPTTDRIKETLFNILASKGLSGAVTVLDLFGGSGALGIESISRGAIKTVFIDRDPDSIKLIRQNLKHVGASENDYEIYNVDFSFALKKLCGKKFDIIFADPPYAKGLEGEIISLIDKYGVLSDVGALVIEHSVDNNFDVGNFAVDKRVCGNTALSFLTYNKEVEHNE